MDGFQVISRVSLLSPFASHCLSTSFETFVSASYLHLEQEPFIRDHTDLLLEIKRKALEQVELHWNPAMKDEVEMLGDVQLYAMYNETTRVCKWFTMIPAPISF